jgi:hypothetical protein
MKSIARSNDVFIAYSLSIDTGTRPWLLSPLNRFAFALAHKRNGLIQGTRFGKRNIAANAGSEGEAIRSDRIDNPRRRL